MKVLIVGKNSKDLEQLIKETGFSLVDKNPDIVISFGGDGTLLSAERKYPGIPKLPIRNSQLCHKCSNHQDKIIFQKLNTDKLPLKNYKKLETAVLDEKFYALNDFVIRNSDPTHTIRFKTSATNDKLLIGDGLVIATPFGSSGYFKSITNQTFKEGFALAFNNTTQKLPPIFLKDSEKINFKLVRGKATLSFDNNPNIFVIEEGLQVNFKLSAQVAKIYEDTSLRCPNCQVIRG